MRGLSMSGLPRANACPGAYALPQAQTESVYSEAGNDRHAIGDVAVKTGALERLPEEVRALIQEGAMVASEVWLAYDYAADAARLMEPGETTGETELGGHADLLIVEPDRVTVVDYKGHEDVGDPSKNEQLMGYALAAARAYSVGDVRVVVAYVEEDDHGGLLLRRPLVERTVDALDLDAFAPILLSIVKRVREQQARHTPDTRESRYCKWCAAAACCPSKVALIKRMVSGGEADELETMLPLSVESAAAAYMRLIYAENLLKRIRSAIYAFAAEHPVPLPNGRVLGKNPRLGNEQLDADVVYDVVRARHGQAAADAAVSRVATKTRLREALKAAGAKPVAPAERAVLEEVKARGGSRREMKEPIEEYTPSLPAAANP